MVETYVRLQDMGGREMNGGLMTPISLLHGHPLKSIEFCAGAGGQALGLERAGFEHVELVEIDADACATLRLNRPNWKVTQSDLRDYDSSKHSGVVDLLAAGLPCPPFSIAGKQLGANDERNLFDVALSHIQTVKPRAVLIENVRGLLNPRFDRFRDSFERSLNDLGYRSEWRLLHSADFGVPQLRPRLMFVALKKDVWPHFSWPLQILQQPPTVGEILFDLMNERHWRGAEKWAAKANRIAPTIVGGSKKHGGPDLGPTRARAAWLNLGVDGRGIANESPERSFSGLPRLTARMVARLQGFTDDWKFFGKKTTAYRQIGNAFPPPVAQAVGFQIASALLAATRNNTLIRRSKVRV
jgi:DNA (cytosine-5)-methyltransferase 1